MESTSIPVEFGNLLNLGLLWLQNNELSGEIPIELGDLSDLGILFLDGNELSGSIPVELGNLDSLVLLGLGLNQLSGNIPIELGKLSKLTQLRLLNNQLSGSIPSELGNLSNLTHLYLHNNQLEGCIPNELNIYCSLGFSSTSVRPGYNFTNNPALPWSGDFQRFCNGEPQIGAPCTDTAGNPATIQPDCTCAVSCPTITPTLTTDNTTICPSGNINLTFTFDAGTSPYDVTYTDGTNSFNLTDIPSGHIETITPTGAGTFSYSLTSATDSTGCPVDVSNTINVTVEDNEIPVASNCPINTLTFDVSASSCEAMISYPDILFDDNCDGMNLSNATIGGPASGDLLTPGTYVVSAIYQDASGNAGNCDFSISVRDLINPTAACQNASIQLDATGNASIDFSTIENGSTDNCTALNNLTFNIDKTTFNCSDVGDNNVILTVTDESGNTDVCMATVTVEGSTAPTTDSDSFCEGRSFTLPDGTQANSAGLYSVILQGANGCDSTINITLTTIPPVIGITENNIICEGETYTWNGNSYAIAGDYTTTLQSIATGCDSIASLRLEVEGISTLGAADAGEDSDVCESEVELPGDDLPGTTGIWQSLSTAIVQPIDQRETIASNLEPGENQFVWKLSSANCADYDSDTVTINFLNERPSLQADIFETSSFNFSIPILQNDVLNDFGDFKANCFQMPTDVLNCDYDEIMQELNVQMDPSSNGTYMLNYSVCSEVCPTLCDSAEVFLTINNPTVDPFPIKGEVSIIITPNGDGMNDGLVFPNLDPADVNELTIFNRWGNSVYFAEHYHEAEPWLGENSSGQELPEASYYFILRKQLPDRILYGVISLRYR